MTPRKQQGAALIEFGLTLSVLITIVFGITEFGRAMYQYDTLAKTTRDAVRYLSTKAPGDAVATDEAICLAVYGKPACTGDPLLPGLTTAMVSVCDATTCTASHQSQGSAPVVNLVTLTIGSANDPYTFSSVAPFVVPDIPFGPVSVTMRQVL